MRKALILLMFVPLFSFGQMMVKDKNTNWQHERIVVTRWSKFKPKWYYVLFHRKYMKGEDRRNMWQLAPTAFSTRYTLQEAELQQEELDSIYKDELWKGFNRQVKLHYSWHYSKKFEALNRAITSMLNTAKDLEAAVYLAFYYEIVRLNGQKNIILSSYLDSGESVRAFNRILAELIDLKVRLAKYLDLHAIKLKYR